MRSSISIVATLLVLGLGGAAHADIYAFVDADGTTHFSNVPVDDRYELVLDAPEAPAAGADPAPVDPKLLARAEQYEPLIDDAARRAEVDPELVRAVIVVESGFDARAVSKRGASGLMQLMPATATRYGARDVFDPQQNIRAGTQYLRDLIDRYDNDVELVLAAYNAGEQTVDRYGRKIPPFAETRDYVPRVLRVYRALRNLTRSI